MQDDELHIENLEDLGAGHGGRRRLLPLMRRLYHPWQGSRGAGRPRMPARVLAGGLTVALALTLVAMAGDSRSARASRVLVGADPIAVTASEAAPPVTLAGQPPAPVGTSDWQQVTLPNAPGTSVRSMVPSPTDPSTIFACTGVAITSPLADPPSGPIAVWRTHDAGQHWRSLTLPPISGKWCELQLAADGSARMTLLIPSQLHNDVFLSDDAGDSWMQATVPTVTPTPENNLTMWVWATAHHLYCWYEYTSSVRYLTTVTSSGSSTRVDRTYVTVVERSDDDGLTWVRADIGLPSSPLDGIFPYQTRDENHLLTRFFGQTESRLHAELWETLDAGRSWHAVMTIGEFAGLLVVPTGGNAAVVDGLADYVTLDEQVPSDLYRLKVLARQGNGPWQPLPPLPVSGAQPDRTGLLQIYEQTDDGRLLAFGVDPRGSVPSADDQSTWNGTPSQWLWIYDPRVARWLAWPSPLPLSYRWGCGVCLGNSATWVSGGATPGTYFWVRGVDGRLGDGYNVAYRVFVPDAPPGQLNASA